MKKFLVLAIAVAVLASLMVTPALANPPSGASQGAVKMALHERTGAEGWNDQGLGEQVGWAIANTNAEDELIVETHLDNGLANTTFDLYVKINGEWKPVDVGELTTNRQGKGNAHVTLDITSYLDTTDLDTIDVQVVVKSSAVGYATATKPVPLKPVENGDEDGENDGGPPPWVPGPPSWAGGRR